MKKRALCLGIAGVFSAWIVVATALWWKEGGSVASSWRHATGDWMTLLFFTDLWVFAGAAAAWVFFDQGRRGFSLGRRLAWLGALFVLGSPVLFVYLAQRDAARSGP